MDSSKKAAGGLTMAEQADRHAAVSGVGAEF